MVEPQSTRQNKTDNSASIKTTRAGQTVQAEVAGSLSPEIIDQQVLELQEAWLTNPSEVEPAHKLSELLRQCGQQDVANQLTKLANTADHWLDPTLLFETAFKLIDVRLHDLAIMLLKRCRELAPNEVIIKYELGFALLSLKLYDQARLEFESIVEQEEDFDTLLNLSVIYTCQRNLASLEKNLARMAKITLNPEQTTEFQHQQLVCKRLQQLRHQQELTARDWMYIHYGSILLKQCDTENSGGQFGTLTLEFLEIGKILTTLAGVLKWLDKPFEVVEYYNKLSRPLAECVGELLTLPVQYYSGTKRSTSALLVVAQGQDLIGPHEVFKELNPHRTIFAFSMPPHQSLPITPEIVGVVAESCLLPWNEQWQLISTSKQVSRISPDEDILLEELKNNLLNLACAVETDPDILSTVEMEFEYYKNREPLLLFCNSKTFKQRPEYSAELP